MTENVYLMSFTAGGLLYHQSVKLLQLYDDVGDWETLRTQVLDENLLQTRTLTGAKRVYREIVPRLKQLTDDELDLLRSGTRPEQNHILWLAICKRYRFIYDFAVEVVREKFLRLDLELAYHDYDIYFNDKAEWYPEVAAVAESTRKKQRQVVFRMLREAELLSSDSRILPSILTPREIETIAADDPQHFAVYPVSPMEIQEFLS